MADKRPIPLWLRLVFTAWVCVLVPVYSRWWGNANFLWFSDITLFFVTFSLWWPNKLLPSMAAVSTLLLETVWNVDFFVHLVSGYNLMGLSAYMFMTQYPLYLRALSLFHVALPVVLIWLLYRQGYDRRALVAQTLLAWIDLLLVHLVSDSVANINWAFRPAGSGQQTWMRPALYLVLVMAFFPIVVYLPTHLVLLALFRRRPLAVAAPVAAT